MLVATDLSAPSDEAILQAHERALVAGRAPAFRLTHDSEMLGHASIVTMQRSTKLPDEAVQREAQRLHREKTGNAAG
jgi:hypothetical protein